MAIFSQTWTLEEGFLFTHQKSLTVDVYLATKPVFFSSRENNLTRDTLGLQDIVGFKPHRDQSYLPG